MLLQAVGGWLVLNHLLRKQIPSANRHIKQHCTANKMAVQYC